MTGRRTVLIVALVLGCFGVQSLIGADAALEKTVDKAKEKRLSELEKAGAAYHKQVEKANAALAKAFESAAATAKRKKDDTKAEALTAAAEKVAAGESPDASVAAGDTVLEGAIKRHATELAAAEKAFKSAVDRANTTLDQAVAPVIAGYKRKSDARADELTTEIAALKAETVEPKPGEAPAPKGGSGSVELIKTIGDSLINTEGKKVPSKSLASQEYVLLYFSANWCGPCRGFTPSLVKFHNDNAKKGKFDVVFVSACTSEKHMLGYMEEDKMPWNAAPYKSAGANALAQQYKIPGYPWMVVLDKDGNVVANAHAVSALATFKTKIGVK